jgi:F0F1-type ATP synthase membrane subunit b/b'
VSAGWVTFAFEAANFLLLMALLAWLFFRPVREALEKRRSEIEGEQRAARAAREEAERERAQLAAERAAREVEVAAARERLAREAESEREALLEAGRTQLKRERERLDLELRAARRAQTRALARDAAFAAHAIVRRLLAELKGPELEESLLASACRDLAELARGGPLAPILIESAGPLLPAQEARIAAAAGVERNAASTRIDPELVAGLRILTARGLVDATVSGISAQTERLLVSRIDGENDRHE